MKKAHVPPVDGKAAALPELTARNLRTSHF